MRGRLATRSRSGDDSREFLFQALHRLWECVAKALDDLEQRQVGIAEPAAEEIGAPAARDTSSKYPRNFGKRNLRKSAARRFASLALVLVVEPGRDRVVGVVDLDDEVGDRELQLVRPQPHGLVARREPMARAEKEQDVRGLADDELAALEERRRERRMLDALAVEKASSSRACRSCRACAPRRRSPRRSPRARGGRTRRAPVSWASSTIRSACRASLPSRADTANILSYSTTHR